MGPALWHHVSFQDGVSKQTGVTWQVRSDATEEGALRPVQKGRVEFMVGS